ncbi:DNA primase [Pirellulimonas nuda]|uniref:DNA primase n=1 Tax=Pirellulimonas nuda TaxID=2528009 RepID=A0A518DFD9_9BACT|nr:DNA primase [Pirellulimonas nuda]QDU90152.1 DNA primase [Pirellulimonas nuda]
MNHPDSQDAKEQVRQAIDIVDLVGGYMQLRRQGRNYVGICPWHDDSKPSLQISQERQTFKCWVCDVGGDLFSFVMRMEGLEFRDALEMLAERAGVTLTAAKPAEAGGPGDKRTLLAACAWAAERFHRCLLHDGQAEGARQYVADRRIDEASVKKFQIGFSPPSWEWILTQAKHTSFSPAVLERIGLAAPRQQGDGFYDRFRGRVMFPIRDVQGRPIAFGGRVLPELADDKSAKYINSPETPLFSKSNQLYALDWARPTVSQLNQLVVMEGYTDVIAAHQHGVENAVAVLGTALTEKHLPLIRRFTDHIVLVLDGDDAGRKRASEVLELFVGNPVDLRILTLPDGLDPCDFIQTHGRDKFRSLIDSAPDALEHKLSSVTKGLVSADQTHEASLAVEQVLATLAKTRSAGGLPDSSQMLREQHVVGRLAREMRLPPESLRSRLMELRRGAAARVARPAVARDNPGAARQPLPAWEQELLELMIADSGCGRRILNEVHATTLTHADARRVFELYARVEAALPVDAEIDAQAVLSATDDPALQSLVVTLDEHRRHKEEATEAPDRQGRYEALMRSFHQRIDRAERRADIDALRSGELDPDAQESALFDLLNRLKKDRQTGSLSTEG